MRGLRGVTLTARFLCELAMLAALAFWGFGAGVGIWALVAVVLGVAGVATSLLNEVQEGREGPEGIRRR
jgi:hypothetical protein